MIALILAAQLISIAVKPAQCLAPCDVELTLTVEPAENNLEVVVTVVGDDYFASSSLDYTHETHRTIKITYPKLEAWEYMFLAELKKHDARTWTAGEDRKKVNI